MTPGGSRRLTRAVADACTAFDEPITCGASIPITVADGPRPQQVGDAAVAHQLHAVEHVGVLAELLGGVLDARPGLRRVEPVDGRVAVLVVQRGEHLDQPDERVGRRPAEHAGVHRAGEPAHA